MVDILDSPPAEISAMWVSQYFIYSNITEIKIELMFVYSSMRTNNIKLN